MRPSSFAHVWAACWVLQRVAAPGVLRLCSSPSTRVCPLLQVVSHLKCPLVKWSLSVNTKHPIVIGASVAQCWERESYVPCGMSRQIMFSPSLKQCELIWLSSSSACRMDSSKSWLMTFYRWEDHPPPAPLHPTPPHPTILSSLDSCTFLGRFSFLCSRFLPATCSDWISVVALINPHLDPVAVPRSLRNLRRPISLISR